MVQQHYPYENEGTIHISGNVAMSIDKGENGIVAIDSLHEITLSHDEAVLVAAEIIKRLQNGLPATDEQIHKSADDILSIWEAAEDYGEDHSNFLEEQANIEDKLPAGVTTDKLIRLCIISTLQTLKFFEFYDYDQDN
jgi:hypothetical protein